MTFRDDNEATLARAEALDREVKRLEEENAKLREERERDAKKLEDVERQATRAERREAEKREQLEELAKAAPKPRPQAAPIDPRVARAKAAQKQARERQHLLRQAFTPVWLVIAAGVLAAVACVGTVYVGLQLLMLIKIPLMPLLIPFVFAGIGLVYGPYLLATNHVIRSTQTKLAQQLPFSFDGTGYVERMATRFDQTLTVEVRFVAEPTDTDRKLYADAVQGGAKAADTIWSGSTLVIISPTLKTFYQAKGRGYSHNAKPHRWFWRLVQRVLLPIAEHDRIISVTLR